MVYYTEKGGGCAWTEREPKLLMGNGAGGILLDSSNILWTMVSKIVIISRDYAVRAGSYGLGRLGKLPKAYTNV